MPFQNHEAPQRSASPYVEKVQLSSSSSDHEHGYFQRIVKNDNQHLQARIKPSAEKKYSIQFPTSKVSKDSLVVATSSCRMHMKSRASSRLKANGMSTNAFRNLSAGPS
jgi:hypothetical protein